ncbi:hypothetical protein E2C01_050876 [Portunus trituberculatus]|uniref:Uncharacterized protein n=1 Tax=Portunus trituberculatus TaxID=210409 RepID=A0A5B7G9G6_PORTR|nr:hypothetical protein [Portunus trituberculatus]
MAGAEPARTVTHSGNQHEADPWKTRTPSLQNCHATLGRGAILKLTPQKPEKCAEEPETAEHWTPLIPRARLGRGAAHTLTPPSPKNSMEGPGTAGEGMPLATGSGAKCGAARKLTLPTTNSRAGLGTEEACPPPPLTPRAKPRGDTLRLTPLLPLATTKGRWLLGGNRAPLHLAPTWGTDAHSLRRPQTLKTWNWRHGATRPLTTGQPDQTLQQQTCWPKGPQKPAPAGENASHWNPQTTWPTSSP